MVDIKELSAMDLHYLLNEFEIVHNSKVENIYQKQGTLYLVLHVTGEGKRILKIMLPSFVYMTEYREEMPEKPPQFCSIIRKYLRNARLRKIEQLDFERILKITFTTKDQTYYLIAELFSKGNLILCNKNLKIIYPMTYQKWKDRTIKGGLQYNYPKKDIDITKIKETDLKKSLNDTKMDSVVTFLAKGLGLGGKYAEIVCKESKISKNCEPEKADPKKIIEAINTLLKKKTALCKDLDKILTEKTIKQEKETKEKSLKEKKTKVGKILDMQKGTIKKQENAIIEGNTKGDLIYKNYNEVSTIMSELREIRKKYTWKEIKQKLKGHKLIKNINEKTGKITLELD